jgi:hypothetical protein
MTSPMPASSARPGSWVSTTTPMTVAVAGSKDSSSANVARDSRANASWSHTYGITEDEIPTPMPASSATGSLNAGTAAQPASGVTATSATSIDAPSPSIPPPAPRCATLWPSTM